MKRTLQALLLCVGIFAGVIAVSVWIERGRAPEIAGAFLKESFKEENAAYHAYMFPGDRSRYSGPRLQQIFRRYRNRLGGFVKVVQIDSVKTISEFDSILEFKARFSKTDADVRLHVRNDRRQVGVVDFLILAPEHARVVPTKASLEHGVGLFPFESFARGSLRDLYDFMGWSVRSRISIGQWYEKFSLVHESYGELKTTRAGDLTEVDPGEYTRTYEIEYERATCAFDVRWRFHDVYWQIEDFKFTVTTEE